MFIQTDLLTFSNITKGRREHLDVFQASSPPPIQATQNERITFCSTRPFARFGFIPFGGRSTAIKLNDGVWVMASTTLDKETKGTIDSLGEVK